VVRQMRGIRNWEKTQHTGVHRARVDRATEMLKEANEHAA
jgi:hypothetical protein